MYLSFLIHLSAAGHLGCFHVLAIIICAAMNIGVHVCKRHYFLKSIYLFIFGRAGSLLLHGLFSSCSKQRLLSSCGGQASHGSGFSCCGAWALGTLTWVVAAYGLRSCGCWLWSRGSAVAALRLCGSRACGIFPDQGLNLCPLHWRVDSFPLSHQGSPQSSVLNYMFLNNYWPASFSLI